MELFDVLALIATGGYLLLVPCFILCFLLAIRLSIKEEKNQLHKFTVVAAIVLAIILYAPIIAIFSKV
jgi:hypothetical protein